MVFPLVFLEQLALVFKDHTVAVHPNEVRQFDPAGKHFCTLRFGPEPGPVVEIEGHGCTAVVEGFLLKKHRDNLLDRTMGRNGFKGLFAGLCAMASIVVLYIVYGVPFIASMAIKVVPYGVDSKIGFDVLNSLGHYDRFDKGATEAAQAFFDATGMGEDRCIVIFKGLATKIEDAEELAGLLAHETIHIRERHIMNNLAKRLSLSIMFDALTGNASGINAVFSNSGQLLLGLSYSKDYEREADEEGANLLAENGISPEGMKRLFQALKKEHGDTYIPEFLSAHPDIENRIKELEERGILPTTPQVAKKLAPLFEKFKEAVGFDEEDWDEEW